MRKPAIRYARRGEASIAYQAVGQGPLDVVLVPGLPSNLEILWEDPGFARLVKRLSAFCRLILLDPRGCGLSDGLAPDPGPSAETGADDIGAVMESAGCGRAALIGASEGAASAMLFAASRPDSCRALVIHGGFASLAPVLDPRRIQARSEALIAGWGSGANAARLAPGRATDSAFADWWGRLERLSASPSSAAPLIRAAAALDIRAILPGIATPTLVLHRNGDAQVPPECARQLAAAIPGARLIALPGSDHPPWVGDVDGLADRIEHFLTGEHPVPRAGRVLAALLVARFLGAAGGAGPALAGRHLSERLDLARDALPRLIASHGGQARWTRSDRLDATFPGITAAAGCAIALRETARSLGLAVAQGLHVGEIDPRPDALAAPAQDIADQIAASTREAEILLSRAASSLVSGSGLHFASRGTLPGPGEDAALPLVALSGERHLEPLKRAGGRLADLATLTPREREVLALVADGLSNPAIAVTLGLSEHTVKRHVANILLKLDLPSRAAVAGLAARQSPP